MLALFHRERTGEGQTIDLSLYDVALMAMVNQAQNWIASGENPGRMGHAHPNIVPYQAFMASDEWFILACGNDAQFANVCVATGATSLQRDELSDNSGRLAARTEIVETLSQIFTQNTAEHWISEFNKVGVPSVPIQSISQAFTDSQAESRNALWRLGDQESVANALRFMTRTPATSSTPPPKLGEHTEEIIRDWLGDA